MLRALLPVLLLGTALADRPVPPPELPHAVEPAGSTEIDWTEYVLRGSAGAEPASAGSPGRMVVEDQARARLGPIMLEAAMGLRLDASTTVADFIAQGAPTSRYIEEQSGTWRAVETRYYTSGKVEVDAELDLFHWLQPLLAARAGSKRPDPSTAGRITGIVVEARRLPVEGALMPRIWSHSGEVLYSVGHVHTSTLRRQPPVLYVTDPAAPEAVERAGENPLFVRATRVESGVDLVLAPQDAIRFGTVSRDERLLAEARVVIVMDPAT